MKTRFTKFLAVLLAVVMMIGLLPMAALAAGENPVTISHNGAESTSEDGLITGSKTIAKKDDGTFDITLSVSTKSTSSSVTTTTPADVVIVMDVTESMDSGNKWTDMKSAADDFINTLLPAGNTTNRVAIITYAGLGYNLLCDWTKDAATAKNTYKNADESDDLRSAIDGTTTSGGRHGQPVETKVNTKGTNCQAGFLGADKQLDTATASLQYVVYMTDGAANRYYKASVTTIGPNCGYYQGQEYYDEYGFPHWHYHDSSCYTTTYAALTDAPAKSDANTGSTDDNTEPSTTCAILQAQMLKTNHSAANLIAVGIGTDNSNEVINPETNTALNSAYNTTDGMTISEILSDISKTITDATSTANFSVNDPMAPYVDLTAPSEEYISVSNSTLSWDLSKQTPVITTSASGGVTTTIKTYTLTYTVSIEKNDALYAAINTAGETVGVPTNGTTTLSYTVNNNGTETNKTFTFDVPKVTCTLPKHDVTYDWGTNVPAGETKPTGSTNVGYGATYTVDSTYTSSTVINEKDDYGNITGTWTFSGWKLGDTVVTGDQTMGDSDVTLTGSWSHTDVTPAKYHITS